MMNLQKIETINVCQRYFHIEDMPIKKYAFKLRADANISMNKFISKKEAAYFIKQRKCVNRSGLSSLSISQVPLCIDMVKDFMNEKIFTKENVRYCGWLLQYDPTPFANWYHDCFYYFVVNYDICQEIKSNRGLNDAIKMQLLYEGC